MSSFIWEKEFNNEYRDLIRSRRDKFNLSVPDIIDTVKNISFCLKTALDKLNFEEQTKIEKYFISDTYKSYFGLEVSTENPKPIWIDRKLIGQYIAKPPTREEKNKDKRNLDFYAVFLGFAGAKGWFYNISLDDCFCLSKNKIEIDKEIAHFFIPERKEGEVVLPNIFIQKLEELKALIIKEQKGNEKKLIEFKDGLLAEQEDSNQFINHIEKIDNKLARAYHYFDNILFELGKSIKLNLGENEFNLVINDLEKSIKEIADDISTSNKDEFTVLKNEINPNLDILIKRTNEIGSQLNELIREQNKNDILEKEGKTTLLESKISFIEKPSYSLFIWRRIKLFFGIKKWIYNIEPTGYPKEVLKQLTKHYIITDYQENETIYIKEKREEADKNILKYLTKHVIELEPLPNDELCKYFFILSDSGIGKTTLLLQLFIEARKKNLEVNRVHFLPFSEWRDIDNIEDKSSSILILDSLDENFDFDEENPDEKFDVYFPKFIKKIKELTEDFKRVVISSRSQFFRRNKTLELFSQKLSDQRYYGYKAIALCPFDKNQVNKFLDKKFKRKKNEKIEAKRIIQRIGGDTLQRQFLISKVDYLFGVFEKDDYFEEANELLLFKEMLQTWLDEEKDILRKYNSDIEEREKIISQTDRFCKILAKKFLVNQKENKLDYEFKDLVELEELKEGEIKKGKLLTNRTFLIRGVNDKYRFAHRSIFGFYLAQVAVEDKDFDKKYFQPFIKNDENKFAKEMYQQYILYSFYEIGKGDFQANIHFTKDINKCREYANDMRFEPYFFMEKGARMPYVPKSWNRFSEISNHILDYKEILGVKFLGGNFLAKFIAENEGSNEINFRRKCFEEIKPLLRFLPKLRCLDLSEMMLSDLDIDKLNLANIEVLNLRNNNLRFLYFMILTERLTMANLINASMIYEPITAYNLVITFSKDLYPMLVENRIFIYNHLYIFLDKEVIDLVEFKADGYKSNAFEGMGDIFELAIDVNYKITIFSQTEGVYQLN